jgi:hypothetical protein
LLRWTSTVRVADFSSKWKVTHRKSVNTGTFPVQMLKLAFAPHYVYSKSWMALNV